MQLSWAIQERICRTNNVARVAASLKGFSSENTRIIAVADLCGRSVTWIPDGFIHSEHSEIHLFIVDPFAFL